MQGSDTRTGIMDDRQLSGYVPIDRRVALATGRQLPVAAYGAALFADVAGYSSLSRELTRQFGARKGAERLSNQMNLVYGALADEVHNWGGSVVTFSGDAITCWFDNAPNGASASPGAARAVACALRLHELTAQVPPLVVGDGADIVLSIKVAVAMGQVQRVAVGDVSYRLIDVIAGPAIDKVASLERQALQGEVVVDEPTAQCVEGVRIRRWKTGDQVTGRIAEIDDLGDLPAERQPWPDVVLDPAVAADWVDSQLRHRPRASLTELRPTSAMFVSFGEILSPPNGGLDRLDPFVRRVQQIAAGQGGSVLQITMGDKGGYLYVAFGAPTAHEHVAARAAAAALEVCGPTVDVGSVGSLTCGLTLGLSRTGSYGGPSCWTYGVVGENVNLAARLMTIAMPGEIVAAAGFARSCGAGFVFDDLAAVSVKGYLAPVPIMRLTAGHVAAGPSRFATPLVGRDGEVQEILALVGLVTSGPGGALVIEGDAGIGKSHLIEHARRTALDSTDVTWLECSADERASGSLTAFLPLLVDLFFQGLGSTAEHRRQLFDATIDSLLDVLATLGTIAALEARRALERSRSYVGSLLGLQWAGSASGQHDPRTRFERCLRGVDDLLRAESLRRPVVVHVRDTQWLDADSERLVALLATSARRYPIAIILDQRPIGSAGRRSSHTTSSDHALLDWSFPHQRVELAGLGSDSVGVLIEGLLTRAPEPRVVAAISERSGGNPFFVEQLVLDLLDRGVLRAEAGGASPHLGDLERDLPLTLAAVLLSRLDRLDAAVLTAVQLAAVLGTQFSRDVLGEMARSEVGTSELADAFNAAESAGVWTPLVDRPGWEAFTHALLRQTAYDMQLDERLALLHARAGAAIEMTRPSSEPGRAAELGHHAERAGNDAGAWVNFVAAGRENVAQSAHGPALDFFERALTHASLGGIRRSELLVTRREAGDVADLLGQYGRSIAHYDGALDLQGSEPGDRTEILYRTARSFERWGRYDEAERRYDRALIELQADVDVGLASRIYGGLSMVHCRRDRLAEAEELAELALLFAQTADNRALLAEAYKNLGIAHLRSGSLVQAAVDSQASLEICNELGDLVGEAAIWNNLGLLASTDGRTVEAIERFRTSVALFERVGNEHGLANVLDNLASSLHQANEQDEAMACLERAIGILAEIGLTGHEVFGAMWKSGTW